MPAAMGVSFSGGRRGMRSCEGARKAVRTFGAALAVCLGLGAIVGAAEKRRGKIGWTDGHKPYGIYERSFKRALDFGLSLFGLSLLWPVMAATAALVKIKLGSPVLFKQKRPGLGAEPFELRKFRTMLEGDGPDRERLTGFGKRLRATSLDELPELWNILKGEMSIVGPRPLLCGYIPYYNECERHRHDVKPGLTGYAQVNGRNLVDWEERFAMDIAYANKITFANDFQIILSTLGKVFKREGVTSGTSATMEGFMEYCEGVGRMPVEK